MSSRILIMVLIVLVVVVALAVPAAFLLGRQQSVPPQVAAEPAPATENVGGDAGAADEAVAVSAPTTTASAEPAPAPKEESGNDLFGGLVSAVGDRLASESRRVADRAIDEVGKAAAAELDEASAKLQRELDEGLERGRKEIDRASRKLGEDLDQRSDSLTRATAEQNAKLTEQSESIAKAGRTSSEAISRTAGDLRTLITTTLNTVNTEADQAKAKLVKLAKDGGTRLQTAVGKAGAVLPGASARISGEIASGLKRWLDEIDGTRADFQKRTTAAHQRFTEAVTRAQAEAEQQRKKAFDLAHQAGEALRSQVAAAERELTDAVRKAESETDQALAKILGQAEQKPENRPAAPARRGGK